MATPLSASQLLRALREEGLSVVEHQNWRTHNRNSKGLWGPVYGVMIHHTVTSGTAYSVKLCYDGHTNLPGPLCHGVIAKDGTLYLVGSGRANHAGLGDADVLRVNPAAFSFVQAADLAIQHDGKIVLAGHVFTQIVTARITSAGVKDLEYNSASSTWSRFEANDFVRHSSCLKSRLRRGATCSTTAPSPAGCQ